METYESSITLFRPRQEVTTVSTHLQSGRMIVLRALRSFIDRAAVTLKLGVA